MMLQIADISLPSLICEIWGSTIPFEVGSITVRVWSSFLEHVDKRGTVLMAFLSTSTHSTTTGLNSVSRDCSVACSITAHPAPGSTGNLEPHACVKRAETELGLNQDDG